jgi:hypothetical protein
MEEPFACCLVGPVLDWVSVMAKVMVTGARCLISVANYHTTRYPYSSLR